MSRNPIENQDSVHYKAEEGQDWDVRETKELKVDKRTPVVVQAERIFHRVEDRAQIVNVNVRGEQFDGQVEQSRSPSAKEDIPENATLRKSEAN